MARVAGLDANYTHRRGHSRKCSERPEVGNIRAAVCRKTMKPRSTRLHAPRQLTNWSSATIKVRRRLLDHIGLKGGLS